MARIDVDILMRDLDRSIQQFHLDADADTASIEADDIPPPLPPKSLADLLKSNEPDAITGYLDYLTPAAAPRDQLNRVPGQFQTRFFALAADGMFMFNSASPTEVLLDSIHVSATVSFVSHMPPLCFEVTDKINGKSWILAALTKTAKNVWLSKLSELTNANSADNSSDYLDLMGSYLDYDESIVPEPGSAEAVQHRFPSIVSERLFSPIK
ncbi:hypothetical protein HDU81_008571 [Chytriomyces hyalinus]|nr:hypothetical protein HDU81_008571 [Chytriomyces hyalinus]